MDAISRRVGQEKPLRMDRVIDPAKAAQSNVVEAEEILTVIAF